MFKLLRKYNKMLLSIFGVLLMITFLIPQAMSKFARESGTRRSVVATVGDGEKVTGEQWTQVRGELDFLRRLGQPIPGAGAPQKVSPEQWYLLVREAQTAGLVASPAALDLKDDQLLQLTMMTREDPNFIRQVVAKLQGIQQLVSLHQINGLYSDRRLRRQAEELLNQVTVQFVALQGDAADSTTEPTEEEINNQFAKYADVLPGAGEDVFGYKLPDRLKLEWLKISAVAVRKAVEQSPAMEEVAVRVHWRKHIDNKVKNFPPIDTGAAIPAVVHDDLLEQLTKETLADIARKAADVLQLNRRGIPEKDGYLVLPANWPQRKMSFTQLAADLQAKFSIELPAYESTGDRWLTFDDVAKLEGIGKATSDKFGPTPVTLTQLVRAAKEFQSGPAAIPIQQDIAGPPLSGSDGSVYIFRIIAADASHKPASVEEVRQTLVADLKRQADYRRLADTATALALEQEAEAQGLLALALAHHAEIQPSIPVQLCNRAQAAQQAMIGMSPTVDPANLPVVGKHRAAQAAIIKYAMSLPAATAVDKLTEEQRIFVVPVPDRLALLVVQIQSMNPLTQEDYVDLMQKQVVQRLLASENAKDMDALKEAFSIESLSKRNNFSYSGGGGQGIPAPGEEPDV